MQSFFSPFFVYSRALLRFSAALDITLKYMQLLYTVIVVIKSNCKQINQRIISAIDDPQGMKYYKLFTGLPHYTVLVKKIEK